MKDRIEVIFAKMDEFRKDATDLATKNNKAAGRRARKASLELEKLMKAFRAESVKC